MAPTPSVCWADAASIASSKRSPGIKAETERRTNAVFVARSRSHAFVDSASSSFRAITRPLYAYTRARAQRFDVQMSLLVSLIVVRRIARPPDEEAIARAGDEVRVLQ